jgi:hypothetical protein
VVQHEGRQHPVDAAVGHRQLPGEGPLVPDRQFPPGGLAAGHPQGGRVRVDAQRLDVRAAPPEGGQEVAGAAADLQDAVAAGRLGAVEELVVDPADAGETGERVVEGQQPLSPHGRQVLVGHVALLVAGSERGYGSDEVRTYAQPHGAGRRGQ